MATCTFIAVDSATKGSWAGVYGADGYEIVNVDTSTPAYATVTPSGNSVYNWGGLTGISPYEASAPTVPDPYIWYGTTIDIDIVLTGGAHQLAFYYAQNDTNWRTLQVDVLDMDAGGAVLDTRTVGGTGSPILQTAPVYLVWACSGHVKIRTTVPSGLNAILAAYFFDPAPALGYLVPAGALTFTTYAPTLPVAGTIQDTQEVVEYAAQYAATIRNTQEAVEYAAQYASTLYDTQEIIEVIWTPPVTMTAYVY